MDKKIAGFSLLEIILVLVLLIIAGLTHGINMFHYPYYENDEGTYMSQAWSLATQGKIAPYSYTFDHAPAGWMLIALWTKLTGGFFTFGFSINSGRVLMLLLHLFSVLLLYLITKKLTTSSLIASFVTLIFSLTPLGIYYQRRVLLDNIMVFWLLLSFYLLLISKNKISLLALSGLIFGISLVTKEVALVFLPVFLYFIYLNYFPKIVSFISWLLPLSFSPLIYLFYALASGGFSTLVSTVLSQLQRPGITNQIPQIFLGWFNLDPLLIGLGFIAIFTNLIIGFKSFNHRLITLFTLLFILYLIRGGLLLEFYIIPLIPLLALNIGIAISSLNFRIKYSSAVLISLLFIFDLFYFGNKSKVNLNLFKSDQTLPQLQAVDWILTKDQPETYYIIDNYAYVDLHAKKDNHFKYAEYYWKVDRDSIVSIKTLGNNWRFVSFIILTPQMKSDLDHSNLPITSAAYKNAHKLIGFYNDSWYTEIWQVIQ